MRSGGAGSWHWVLLLALGSATLGCDGEHAVEVPDADAQEGMGRALGRPETLEAEVVPTADSVAADAKAAGLGRLSSVTVPRPTRVEYINLAAAERLGKALFWDTQVGGDGQVACATCHAKAGTDARVTNRINPGPNGIFQAVSGPGQSLNEPAARPVMDDIVGSQGVVGTIFSSVAADPTVAADLCTPDHVAPFGPYRRVTGMNSPSTIGAVFNRYNFWNGRANHVFNRQDPFGASANAAAPRAYSEMSSLASQAVGPPNNPTEMSCAGRPFNGPNSLGSKLLARPVLQYQEVAPDDSVLGSLSAYPSYGLRCGTHACTYQDLVTAAYGPLHSGATAMNEFSAYFGESIQAYESLLVPDETPLDKFLAGQKTALTRNQQRGLEVFIGKGDCTHCHAGPELTDASVGFFLANGALNEDGGDQGFHNLGVRPTSDDLGRAGTGALGFTLSESGAPMDRGAFKTPGLRNLGLTAPYFHNGGKATLAEVVDFYARGGDFANPERSRRFQPLSLSATDRAALVDFLQNGLTDCRVAKERAPFDHPSILLAGDDASLPAVGADGTGSCP